MVYKLPLAGGLDGLLIHHSVPPVDAPPALSKYKPHALHAQALCVEALVFLLVTGAPIHHAGGRTVDAQLSIHRPPPCSYLIGTR